MSEMKHDNIVSIRDLHVQFVTEDATVHAVNGVDLDIVRGETIGLVGETGAGKTTIAKAIMGILPTIQARIPSGSITFNGENLLQISKAQYRKIRGNKISMIFQDPMTALNPVMTVGDQIAETVKIHEKVSAAVAEAKAAEMLELVGIPAGRMKEYPHQFSGGMKQRVVIAMALACKPELLIADEPTTALDVTIQAQVLEMISELKEQLGTSVLLITHDLGVVAEMCQRVAVIYCGEVVEFGTAEDIFDRHAHPYTQGLFDSLPSCVAKGELLKPMKGWMPDPADLPVGCTFADRCPHATEQCLAANPTMQQVGPSHYVRCWLAGKED